MTYLLEAADIGISTSAGAAHLSHQIFMEDFFELRAVVGVNGHEVNETSLATRQSMGALPCPHSMGCQQATFRSPTSPSSVSQCSTTSPDSVSTVSSRFAGQSLAKLGKRGMSGQTGLQRQSFPQGCAALLCLGSLAQALIVPRKEAHPFVSALFLQSR
jgi:hypothetical protein